jgi:hypothetical protein
MNMSLNLVGVSKSNGAHRGGTASLFGDGKEFDGWGIGGYTQSAALPPRGYALGG